MNSLYKLLKTVVLILSLFSFISCSNKMTKEKAKDLIIKKYNFPYSVSDKLQYGEIIYSRSFGGPLIDAENRLAEKQLITFNYQGEKKDMFFSYDSYFLDLTQEGMKYKTGETSDNQGRSFYLVKVVDKVFLDIQDIIQINDGKAAQVKYSWKYENLTPFGEAFNMKNQQLNESDRFLKNRKIYSDGPIFIETIMLIKNDNGWFIQED